MLLDPECSLVLLFWLKSFTSWKLRISVKCGFDFLALVLVLVLPLFSPTKQNSSVLSNNGGCFKLLMILLLEGYLLLLLLLFFIFFIFFLFLFFSFFWAILLCFTSLWELTGIAVKFTGSFAIGFIINGNSLTVKCKAFSA